MQEVILLTRTELQSIVDEAVDKALKKAAAQQSGREEFLSEEQVKEMLAVSTTQLWRLRNKGRFPEPIKIGRRNIYRLSDVMKNLPRHILSSI